MSKCSWLLPKKLIVTVMLHAKLVHNSFQNIFGVTFYAISGDLQTG